MKSYAVSNACDESGRASPRNRGIGRSVTAVLMTAALVSACATTPDRIEPNAMQTRSDHYATVVRLIDYCPSDARSPKLQVNGAGVTGAVLGLVSDTVTKWITAKLKERQDGLTATYIGRGTGKVAGCLIVVRGRLGTRGDNVVESSGSILNKAMLEKIGLADYPDLYFEAAVSAIDATTVSNEQKQSHEAAAYEVTPKFLYFRNTAAKYTENGRKSLLMSVQMSATQSSAPSTEDKPTLTFAFDNVPMGVEITPIESQAAVLVIPKEMVGHDLNLLTQITETEDPSLFAKAFAEAVEEKKADISKALEEILTRAFRKARSSQDTSP